MPLGLQLSTLPSQALPPLTMELGVLWWLFFFSFLMVCSFVLLLFFSLQFLASFSYGKIQICLCAVRLLLSMNSLQYRKNMKVTEYSISEAFFSQLPHRCNITSVAYVFPQSLCTLKTTITFSYTWSCSDRKLESRKNAHQHEQWFGYTFPVFFTRGSQHVLQTLINYSFCEVHRHYGLHYRAEETEVHQISSPSICRGWVPTGPNKSESVPANTFLQGYP